MTSCVVPECRRNKIKNPELSFYTFPIIPKYRQKWINAIRRKNWEPTPHSRICSWHFPKGREFGPSRFDWNENKQFNFPDPSPARKRLKCQPNEVVIPVPMEEEIQTSMNSSCQTEMTMDDICTLESHRAQLLEHLNPKSLFADLVNNDEMINHYTGIPMEAFNCLVITLEKIRLNYYHGYNVVSLRIQDQLLLTLMKLRHNFTLSDLSFRFGVSNPTVANIFLTIVYALHKFLFTCLQENFPSSHKCSLSLPESFAEFSNCRMILDCTEIFIERHRNDLHAQKITYSHYKGANTFKALVAVAPNGTIIFISSLYSGCISDKQIVNKSNILSSVEAGDLILADKGFLISDLIPPGVCINIPAFLPPSKQFTVDQVLQNKKIARARIHVERAIGRIKMFKILDKIPNQYRCHANKFFQLCACLVNLQRPILATV